MKSRFKKYLFILLWIKIKRFEHHFNSQQLLLYRPVESLTPSLRISAETTSHHDTSLAIYFDRYFYVSISVASYPHLGNWRAEHGSLFANGLMPHQQPITTRHYLSLDSMWATATHLSLSSSSTTSYRYVGNSMAVFRLGFC